MPASGQRSRGATQKLDGISGQGTPRTGDGSSPVRGRRPLQKARTVEHGKMTARTRVKPLFAGLPFGALAERDFRLLFIGRTISLFGSAFAPIALAFAVVRLTGSPSDLGLVLSAYMLAHLVFLLAGGVWADRLPRHLVMVTSDLLSGASQIAAAVVLLTGVAQTWHLVVLAALRGGASAFFMPASAGLVPQIVSAGRLQQANALLSLSRN